MNAHTGRPERPVRVGLIGCGGIGRAHAQAAAGLDGVLLTAVADERAEAAVSVGAEQETRVLAVDELADRDRFDLVVVATPPATHPSVVEPLLWAGVPVLCEKPIAVDLGSARKLAASAADTGTLLSMAAKFRFTPDVLDARELIDSGELGTVLSVEVMFAGRVDMTRRWNADAQVAGGGVLIDNATHAVDLVHYLIGPIREVLAVSGPPGQPVWVEDSVTLLARTEAGPLVRIEVTWSYRRLSSTYLAVHGTGGTVEVGWPGASAVTARRPEPFTFGSGYSKIDSLRANLCAVADAIVDGTPPPVTVEDAIAAAAVIEAGYQAMRTGRWARVEATI